VNALTPENITARLKIDLQRIDSDRHDKILKTEKSIGICSATLLDLREYVNHSVFKNKEEEIHFFKSPNLICLENISIVQSSYCWSQSPPIQQIRRDI